MTFLRPRPLLLPLVPLLLTLLGAAQPALAQNPGALLPDGSSDMYVGVGASTSSAVTPGTDRTVRAVLLMQVLCSNGVFVDNGVTLGKHMSATPGIEYGPYITRSEERHPSDSRALAGTRDISGTLDVGGFFNYYLDNRTIVRSGLQYDSSARGLSGYLSLQHVLPEIAPHHTVALSVGVSAANGGVMREQYGVWADGTADAPRSYRPVGGVMSMRATASWNWSLGKSWIMSTHLTASRLGGPAADSPIVSRRDFLSFSTGLGYRF